MLLSQHPIADDHGCTVNEVHGVLVSARTYLTITLYRELSDQLCAKPREFLIGNGS